ncbi:MAG TPA: universal stress protein [Desulfosarcina sp.]|nr:universal stress protein [Desulfosarcina sp.]
MQPKINRILFTSDLSDNSKHAFQYASAIAGRFCAGLVFLYVMEDVPMSAKAFLDEEMIEKIRRQTTDSARSKLIGKRREMSLIESELSRFCEAAFDEARQNGQAHVDSQVKVVEGNVIEAIITVSEEMNCDAIVLGSSRRGAIAEAMLGSVVKGVLRQSRKLVIVAPPK